MPPTKSALLLLAALLLGGTSHAAITDFNLSDALLRKATRSTAQAIYLLNHALPAKADNSLTLALDYLTRLEERLKKRREALRDETR